MPKSRTSCATAGGACSTTREYASANSRSKDVIDLDESVLEDDDDSERPVMTTETEFGSRMLWYC